MSNRVKRDTSGYGRSGGRRAIRPHKYREEKGRRADALAETRRHQAQIDAAWEESKRIIREAEEQAKSTQESGTIREFTTQLIDAAKVRAAEETAAKRREQWTLGQARSLVRQGYTVEHVIQATGWARSWVEDADRIFD